MVAQIFILSLLMVVAETSGRSPHIILIVADDLGWNDVGFHGSLQIPTPNLDALATAGVILNNYYVQPICTPSRSALLTGLHPIHTGLNHDVIYAPAPYGIPLNFHLLPEYLKALGYKRQAVGKWHLGMATKEYTPLYRGFLSHYGYWTGHEDYYSHMSLQHGTIGASHPYGLPLSLNLLPQYLKNLGYSRRHVGKWHLGYHRKSYTPTYRGFESHKGYWSGRVDYFSHTAYERPGWWGYDFRRNMEVDREAYGQYTTDLLTAESVKIISKHNASQPLFLYLAHLAVHSGNPYDPLQAPSPIVRKFSYIKNTNRRKFAAMLWKLDKGVGQVVNALKKNEMLENSIIVFTTDNGGAAAGFNQNAGSNWPLRGVKAGMWEGGIRGAGFVWSPLIRSPGRVSHDMMQIVDWLPTLYSAAGGNVSTLPMMDGLNVWPTIANEKPSPRIEMLHNIDPVFNGASLRAGEWKLIFNPSEHGPEWDGWFGPSGRPQEDPSLSRTKIEKLTRNSPAWKAIKKLMPKVYKNWTELKKKAEVLCGPIPANATKSCSAPHKPCLFHIPSDPCEYYDVSSQHPKEVKYLMKLLADYNKTALTPANQPWDPKANPVYWGYAWTNWKDYSLPRSFTEGSAPFQPEEQFVDHIWL